MYLRQYSHFCRILRQVFFSVLIYCNHNLIVHFLTFHLILGIYPVFILFCHNYISFCFVEKHGNVLMSATGEWGGGGLQKSIGLTPPILQYETTWLSFIVNYDKYIIWFEFLKIIGTNLTKSAFKKFHSYIRQEINFVNLLKICDFIYDIKRKISCVYNNLMTWWIYQITVLEIWVCRNRIDHLHMYF